MIKTIVIIAFILIIISLGSALFHLIQSKTGEQSQEQAEKTVKALTFRIILSLVLFVFVFIMVATGLYKPQGIGAGMQMHKPISTENK
jgi:cytochrome c biogenesis factor